MGDEIDRLRIIFLELRGHCIALQALSRLPDTNTTREHLEEVVQLLWNLRIECWPELQRKAVAGSKDFRYLERKVWIASKLRELAQKFVEGPNDLVDPISTWGLADNEYKVAVAEFEGVVLAKEE